MNIFEPIILGLVLNADSFSAAIALGLKPHRFKDSLKFACLSGGAELIATFIGALAGEKIISQFSTMSHWVAALLLFIVAIHMLYESVIEWKNQEAAQSIKFHGFLKLMIVSLATSLDGLAVGVSLGIANKPLPLYLMAIGGGAFISTLIGMRIASKIPKRLSVIFSLLGAVILLILAAGMLR